MYEALIKVNPDDSLDHRLSEIRMQLHELANRLVTEYGQAAEDVEDWFTECVDIAHDAETEID